MNLRLKAANDDLAEDMPELTANSPLLLDWLTRLTKHDTAAAPTPQKTDTAVISPSPRQQPLSEDWNTVAHLCGYSIDDFAAAKAPLPLTAAEVDYFRRNHRGTENHISRDFLTAQTDLPSPLAELYGLYRHRARVDAEAALFIAQATNSTRVPNVMADLLAIGAFANGLEYVSYLGVTYSVPCAFDTSLEIDRAISEAQRRLSLPIDHPSHLLKLRPEELGILAASIAERSAQDSADFLEKANLLSEARQDVNRLPVCDRFVTVITEGDLPANAAWTDRLNQAFQRILPQWAGNLPEEQEFLQ